MEILPLKTQRDYRRTLKQIEGLMTAKRNTPAGDRLDVLVTLVEAWEARHHPLDLPDPIAAIRYHMEQNGLAAERSGTLHRRAQPGLRGIEPQAAAEPQDDLAFAPGARYTRGVIDQG